MSIDAYRRLIAESPRDRRDLFLAAAQRLGTPLGNIEKDFWVCWTLRALYHDRPAGAPRLLFKGGTSLSKAYGLVQRFSEDVDLTVFRDDLQHPASLETLEALSNRRRRATLEAIRNACRAYITGPLRDALQAQLSDATDGHGRVDVDSTDADGQSLVLQYPTVEPMTDTYVRPAVRLEAGAKSALDPHRVVTIRPYVMERIPTLDLTIGEVMAIDPTRTFWDKVVIAHGLRRWYERRGALRQEGQRISRHYYDLYCLMRSPVGASALADRALGADCVRHARLFFDRPDYDLASAGPGTFAVVPVAGMTEALRTDYDQMSAMIFGTPPAFPDILDSMQDISALVNA